MTPEARRDAAIRAVATWKGRRRHQLARLAAAGVLTAVCVSVVTGCGQPGGQPSQLSAAASVSTHGSEADNDEAPLVPQHAATVSVAVVKGRAALVEQASALYFFSADPRRRSACTGACARRWTPLVSLRGKPHAGTGASAALVGSLPRPDNAAQVSYDGQPLYRFVGDRRPGQASGDGLHEFGGVFHLALVKGDK